MQNLNDLLNALIWIFVVVLMAGAIIAAIVARSVNLQLIADKLSLEESLRIALNKLEVKDVEIERLQRFKNMIPDPKVPDLIISSVAPAKFRFSTTFADTHSENIMLDWAYRKFGESVADIARDGISINRDEESNRWVVDFEYIFKILPNV